MRRRFPLDRGAAAVGCCGASPSREPTGGPMSEQTSSAPKPAVPHIAQKAPFAVEVEEGKIYFWCACGLFSRDPFCDGSH